MASKKSLERRAALLLFRECSSHLKCRKCDMYDDILEKCVLASVLEKEIGSEVDQDSVIRMVRLTDEELEQL